MAKIYNVGGIILFRSDSLTRIYSIGRKMLSRSDNLARICSVDAKNAHDRIDNPASVEKPELLRSVWGISRIEVVLVNILLCK